MHGLQIILLLYLCDMENKIIVFAETRLGANSELTYSKFVFIEGA